MKPKTRKIVTVSAIVIVSAVLGGFFLWPKCEVHGMALRPDSVDMIAGAVHKNEDMRDHEAMKFPHAATRIISTDAPLDFKKHTRVVMFCAACRAAERDWLSKHPMIPILNREQAPGGDR